MTPDDRRALEDELAARLDAGELDAAMTVAVRGYGPELFAFLALLTHDRERAGDVFADTCERIWRGLAGFRRDCTFRVWAYQIARHEFLRSLRAVKKERRQVPWSQVPSIAGEFDRVRTATPVHDKSEVKAAFEQLRASLEPDDHLLLALRIDRKMRWADIARVLGSGEDGAAARDAATLRKRYERLKDRLRAAAGA